MEFTYALVDALRAAAPSGDLKIGLASDGKLILEHISGAQMLVNPLNIAQLVAGDPQRLVEEAEGAIAVLLLSVSQRGDNLESPRDLLVPVIQHRDWLEAARKQFGIDLLVEGLATPFGEQLIVTFSFEYNNRREPVIEYPGFGEAYFAALLAIARANQERMLAAAPERLTTTELIPDECEFFLLSTNLQAASLILTGLPQQTAAAMNNEAASTLLGIVVSADVIAFRAAIWDDVKTDADILRSCAAGLRKAFDITESWGDDVFKINADWPTLIEQGD